MVEVSVILKEKIMDNGPVKNCYSLFLSGRIGLTLRDTTASIFGVQCSIYYTRYV